MNNACHRAALSGFLVAAVVGAAYAPLAHAAWPEKPVRFTVPFPAGGPSDNAMRITGKRLNEIWAQPVIVENKPGAPGMVAVASAAPDGYNLLLGAGSNIVTAPLMNSKLAYKPLRDFAPITLLVTNTSIMTVHPGLGVKTVRELIALAKAKPNVLNYSSSGIGSPSHLMMVMFNEATDTKMTHVPYKGGAPAVTELLAGMVQIGINATPTVLQYIQLGKLVPLAVSATRRDRNLPNVPTMAESGVAHLEYGVWYGIFAPAKTAPAIIDKVSTDIRKVLAESETAGLIRAQGNEPEGNTPQQFAQMLANDVKIWGELIREKKLTLDE